MLNLLNLLSKIFGRKFGFVKLHTRPVRAQYPHRGILTKHIPLSAKQFAFDLNDTGSDAGRTKIIWT